MLYFVFIYCWFYLTSFFPFNFFLLPSRLSQNFYLNKMRLKTPATCKVVGSWLCFFVTIGFLMPLLAREHIFYVVQAKRGFAKEASVYFPYLDSILFRTVHYATLPFCHSAIPPFRHSAIPPFHHSAILLSRHSAIPPFRHSVIPPFWHSTIPPFRHSTPIRNNAMHVSQEVLRKRLCYPEVYGVTDMCLLHKPNRYSIWIVCRLCESYVRLSWQIHECQPNCSVVLLGCCVVVYWWVIMLSLW